MKNLIHGHIFVKLLKMNKKTYELHEVLEAFGEGFANGFSEGRTRNIITQKYYAQKYDEAVEKFKEKLTK